MLHLRRELRNRFFGPRFFLVLLGIGSDFILLDAIIKGISKEHRLQGPVSIFDATSCRSHFDFHDMARQEKTNTREVLSKFGVEQVAFTGSFGSFQLPANAIAPSITVAVPTAMPALLRYCLKWSHLFGQFCGSAKM
jgi:hypothetical protein